MKTERVTRAGAPRRAARAGDKKLSEPVTLFAAIEAGQGVVASQTRVRGKLSIGA